jgi:RimJ/RimL family protein N-acetyltransferase
MPFGQPWTRAPAGELERNVIQHHWRTRAEWTPENWSWNPVVVVDGEIVGTQSARAEAFGLRRTVATGSWLGRPFQRIGLGTEMRAAVLHLCFVGLYAARAETTANDTNAASLAVTRKLGYQPNGDHLHAVEGRTQLERRFVLHRDQWEQARRNDIEIQGLDACLDLFGAKWPPGSVDLPVGPTAVIPTADHPPPRQLHSETSN